MGDFFILIGMGILTGFFYTFLSLSSALVCANFVQQKGIRFGWAFSLGVLSMQFIWSLFAAFILQILFLIVGNHPNGFSIVGAIVLFLMAARVYRGSKETFYETPQIETLKNAFGAGFYISLTDPTRILGFTAIFATLSVHTTTHPFLGIIPLIFGVIVGVSLFWFGLTLLIQHLHGPISPKYHRMLRQSASLILVAFSVIGMLQIFLR